jgi:hypothetical protein
MLGIIGLDGVETMSGKIVQKPPRGTFGRVRAEG